MYVSLLYSDLYEHTCVAPVAGDFTYLDPPKMTPFIAPMVEQDTMKGKTSAARPTVFWANVYKTDMGKQNKNLT